MKSAVLCFDEINIGSLYEFERIFTKDDVKKFADLSGDYNPLHLDAAYGQKSPFGKNIIHGMLAASFFSTLIGMYCPGERALYLGQTLEFKKPLFVGDQIKVRGVVIEKRESTRLIVIKTQILRGKEIAINGEAKVRVIE